MTPDTNFRQRIFLRIYNLSKNDMKAAWANSLKIILTACLFFLFPVNLQAQSVQKLTKKAEDFFSKGKYEQVIELLKDKEELFYNTQNDDDRLFFNETLGYSYYYAGNYESAEKYFLEAKEIREKVLGKEHPDYATSLNTLGNLYYYSGNYELAGMYYLEVKGILEKVSGKEHPNYATTLNNLGNLYHEMGDYELAEKYLLETIKIQERVLDKTHHSFVLTLSNLGWLYQDMGNYELAKKYYTEANEIYGIILGKEHPNYTNTLNRLGILYDNTSDYALSEKYYLEAREILEKVFGRVHPDYATIVSNLGQLYNNSGNYILAEKYLLEAKEIRGKVLGKEHPDYALILNNLGGSYNKLGKYELAEKYYIESKEITEKILGKEHPDYARLLNNIGQLYNELGEYELAEKHLLEAKEIRGKILGKEHPDYTTSINNLGLLYCNLGNYELAEKYLLETNKIFEKNIGKDHPYYAIILTNLGRIYYDLNNYESAEEYLLEAKETFKKNIGKDHPDYATILTNLGQIHCELNNYESAMEYLLEAKEIREKVLGKVHPDYAHSLNNLGNLYRDLENFELAERHYLRAKEVQEKALGKEHPDYAAIVDNISGFYYDKKDFNASIRFLDEYNHILKNNILQNFSFMSERQRERYWSDNLSGITWGYNLLPAHPVPEVKALSYNNLLFSKGLLLQTTNEIRDAILSSGNPVVIHQYNELKRFRQQVTALQTQSDPENRIYIERLEIKADSLDKALTQSSSAYREGKDKMTIDWLTVRDNLLPDEIAVEFVDYSHYNKDWTDSIMYCALIIRHDSESPEYVPLFEQSQLSGLLNDENPETTKRVQKLYNVGNTRFYNGQKLYHLIWKPLEKYLDGIETIYYSPAGLLNRISFAAIPTDTLLLNDKYNLQLLSSTREIVRLKTKETDFLPLQQAALYGGILYDVENPEELVQATQKYNMDKTKYIASRSLPDDFTRSGWAYLQGTEKEVVEVEHILHESNVPNIKFMGISANEESFKNLPEYSPELIHIATHGFFLSDEKEIRETGFMQMINNRNHNYINPLLRSGLLFAGANRAWQNENVIFNIEDGILTAEEISQLNLSKTKLVVLSACETGLGEVINSEGVFGLQRAFKLAGAETIVMSLWKVDDATTKDFMIAFYQNLLSGKTKLQSFKSAQQKIKGQHSNPYYWAAFVIMD